MQNTFNKISVHGKHTGVQLLLQTEKQAWFCYKLQDPGEEHWGNLDFISQLLYETSFLAIKNTTSDYKKKIDFFSNFTKAVLLFFFLQ